jgi:alkylation response protein AidB-like acyl-CoA dehydrogenase
MRMDFTLTVEQRGLIDATRALLSSHGSLSATRRLADSGESFDRDLWRLGAELGWPALAVAESDGGLGQQLVDLALVAIEHGRSLAPSPFIPTVVAADALARSDIHDRAAMLSPFVDGTATAAWAFAEHKRPWSIGGIQMRAEEQPDGFKLRGAKVSVQDADSARWLLVDALLSDEPARFVVPAESPGLSVTRQRSLDVTRAYFDVEFDNVVISRNALCSTGPRAVRDIEQSLAMTAVLACAELVGVGRELLEMTVDYVTKRVQFGKPVGTFQAVKHKCADMRIGVQGSTAATYYAAMAVGAQTADWRRAVSIAKAYASNTINDVAGEALQLHGGIGFTWEHDLHLYLRRARANSLLYGDSRYHREVLCSAAAEATSPD